MFAVLMAYFDHFEGQKSCFVDFFKGVYDLFKRFLSFVFSLKIPSFWFISNPKVDK